MVLFRNDEFSGTSISSPVALSINVIMVLPFEQSTISEQLFFMLYLPFVISKGASSDQCLPTDHLTSTNPSAIGSYTITDRELCPSTSSTSERKSNPLQSDSI